MKKFAGGSDHGGDGVGVDEPRIQSGKVFIYFDFNLRSFWT
jgi:hypothetical protein|tara:strand:- start:2001 stop:2123 length:123 start_codon:yes stop_codon:yes gene_type:complete